MRRAGFVLVGGKSTRMGMDKALLAVGHRTLLEAVASKIAAVPAPVSLIGDPDRYSLFGFPVYPDYNPGYGPLSGLQTILQLALAEWNLVMACDMPGVPVELLRGLVGAAEGAPGPVDCVLPTSAEGPQPLCAVYHQRCLPVVQSALSAGRLKVRDLVAELRVIAVFEPDQHVFANLNTPSDWANFQAANP